MASKRNNPNMVDISGWLPVVDARAKMRELISQKIYKLEDIRLSSQRFANKKDKTDGYEAKILVTPGIHPELETGLTYSHGSPKVVNSKVKEQIINKQPLDNPSNNGNLKIGDNKFQILEIVNNKPRTKLYYWLREIKQGPNNFVIAESPYNKDYLNLNVIKIHNEDSEQSFCDWTRLCNAITTRTESEVTF